MLTDFEKNVLGATGYKDPNSGTIVPVQQSAPAPAPAPKIGGGSFFGNLAKKTVGAVADVGIGFVKGAADTVMSVPRNIEKVVVEGTKLSIEKQNNKIREQINAQNDELLKVFKSLPKEDPRREKYKKLIEQNMEQFNALNNSEAETIAQVDQDASWVPMDQEGKAEAFIDKNMAAKNTAQRIGFGAEKIGEFIVPSMSLGKADKALKGMRVLNETSKGAKIFNAGARILSRSGLEAGTAALTTLGQGAYQGRLDTEEGRAGLGDEMKRNAIFAGSAKALFSAGGEILRNTRFMAPKGIEKIDPKTQNEVVHGIEDTKRTLRAYQQGIEGGDMSVGEIYKGTSKILTDGAKQNLVDDIAGKFKMKLGGAIGKTKEAQFRAAMDRAGEVGWDDIERIAKETLDNTDVEAARKVAGEIIQGPKELQDTGRKVLTKLDTSKVRSYDDLAEVIRKRIGENSTTVDDAFNARPEKIGFDKLAKEIKVGDKIIKANPVDDALNHLEEFYDGSKDYANAERIRQLKEAGSLTAKEVNDVAREYSREFSSKAFNKVGDPLTSVNARAMENTRSSVKEIARSLIDGDGAKLADKETSQLYNVLKYAEDNAKKATVLRQKLTDRGLLEKAGDWAGHTVDKLTGGSVRSFVTSFFPRGQGLKPANFVELENGLAKNLDKLNKLQQLVDNGASDQTILDAIAKFGKEAWSSGAVGNATRRVLPVAADYVMPPDISN